MHEYDVYLADGDKHTVEAVYFVEEGSLLVFKDDVHKYVAAFPVKALAGVRRSPARDGGEADGE